MCLISCRCVRRNESKIYDRRIAQEEAMVDGWLDKADLSESIKQGAVVQGRKGDPAVGGKSRSLCLMSSWESFVHLL